MNIITNNYLLTSIQKYCIEIRSIITGEDPVVLVCSFDSEDFQEFERIQRKLDHVRNVHVISLLSSPNDQLDDYIRQKSSEIIMDMVKLDKENHILYSNTAELEEAIQKLRRLLDQL
jgi:hypothetical protein